MKWHEVTWNDMKWYKMMWNDIKWHEVVRNMIWNEKKGLKRIWKDIDRTEYLQSTLHKTDRSPCLDVAAAITCNNDKYLRSFLLCLRSRMAKKFKWCSITLYCKGLVEGTASCFDFMRKEHSILTESFPLRDVAGGPCLGVICTKPWKGASVVSLFGSWA